MACYKHPEREAVAKCSICGQAICDECNIEIGGSNYCKDCVNSLISDEKEETPVDPNTQSLEDIAPISKPQNIPYNEEVEVKDNFEVPETQVKKTTKAPENYEPEYDYQTNYVESYGEEDYEEDSYYENPEEIPEPRPEYQRRVVEQPIMTENSINRNEYQDDVNNIENKYERYLDDLYYNEPENSQNYDNIGYDNSGHYTEEPVYEGSRYNQEPQYQEEYYYDDSEYIVPAHQRGINKQDQSYEDIKREIELQNFREENQKRNSKKRGKKGKKQDLKDIQRMHNYEEYYYDTPKDDNKFTTGELILTVVLIILIIIVIFYLVYLFALKGYYPTIMDAIYGLSSPQTFIGHLMGQ